MEMPPANEPSLRRPPKRRKGGALSVKRIRYSPPPPAELRANLYGFFDSLGLNDALFTPLESTHQASTIETKPSGPPSPTVL